MARHASILMLAIALLLPGCMSGSPASPDLEENSGPGNGTTGGSLGVGDPSTGEPGNDGAPTEPAAPDLPPPEPGTYDLQVRVDASSGPHGQATPVVIDRDFYGVNIADWKPNDYKPEPDATVLAYLRALEPGVLRWPAGHSSQAYQWERAPEANGARRVLHAEDVDAFLNLAREVGAQPLLAVNQKTGTPEAAADFVRYVNIEQGHNVVWWQIGNEPDHLDGLTEGPEQYAHDYVRFAKAMRAVDPNIKLVGGELMSGVHVVGSNNRQNWMETIASIAGHEMDALSWHYYPMDSGQTSPKSSAYPTVEHLFDEVAGDWPPAGMSFADQAFPEIARISDAHAPGAEVWVTEIAEDSGGGGATGIADAWSGGLWTADIMGRFASHGVDAMTRFVFKSGDSHRYTLLTSAGDPRPQYYVYWLMANHFGERIVHAQSDDRSEVAAHAALREDGSLAVMLVNKRTEAHDVRLSLDGFAPGAQATMYTIVGDSYETQNVTLNGERLTVQNVAQGPEGEAWEASADGVVPMPPLSVRMIVFPPAA